MGKMMIMQKENFRECGKVSTNEMILKALKDSDGPLKAGDIAQIAGIDKKEIDKGIKTLKNEGRIITPKRCYYSISE